MAGEAWPPTVSLPGSYARPRQQGKGTENDTARINQLAKRTTHADHTIWQDVYRPQTSVGDVYLKLTVIDDVLIVSFKEL